MSQSFLFYFKYIGYYKIWNLQAELWWSVF